MPEPRTVSKQQALAEGFDALDGIWLRGVSPRDLDRHFLLFWFIYSGGNILETARRMGIHRNTIQDHFATYGFSGKAVRLRHAWWSLAQHASHQNFEKLFHVFYTQKTRKPKLHPLENEALIHLWVHGFPRKVLMHHFLLWGVRQGYKRTLLAKRLSVTIRHVMRLLADLKNPRSDAGKWLHSLKPKSREWYRPDYRGRWWPKPRRKTRRGRTS